MIQNRTKADQRLIHYEGKMIKLNATPHETGKSHERFIRNKEKLAQAKVAF